MVFRIRKSMVAISFILALSACDAGPDTVAKNWLDALNAGQLTAAKKMSTEQSQAVIDMAGAMVKSLAVAQSSPHFTQLRTYQRTIYGHA